MIREGFGILVFCGSALGFVPWAEAAGRIVHSADEVCPAASDPCVVSSLIVVPDETVLDFGTRTLTITGKGQFRLAGWNIQVLCGSLVASTGDAFAIRQRRGESPQGYATLKARRRCSGDAFPCLQDSDCTAGTCSVGDGSIDLDGAVQSGGALGGEISLHAAGDVVLSRDVTSRRQQYFYLGVHSYGGAMDVTGDVRLTSLDDGVLYEASGDIRIDGKTALLGNGYSSNDVDVFSSSGNVDVRNDIDVSAHGLNGEGGTVYLTAHGDISIEGGTAEDPLTIAANGARRAYPAYGDGGRLHVQSDDGDIVIGPHAEFLARAATPDAYAGYIQATASLGDISFAGTVRVEGGKSSSSAFEGCHVTLASGSSISLTHELGRFVGKAHESLLVETGAALVNSAGTNEFKYRAGTPAPVVNGTVTPTATLTEDGTLSSCGP